MKELVTLVILTNLFPAGFAASHDSTRGLANSFGSDGSGSRGKGSRRSKSGGGSFPNQHGGGGNNSGGKGKGKGKGGSTRGTKSSKGSSKSDCCDDIHEIFHLISELNQTVQDQQDQTSALEEQVETLEGVDAVQNQTIGDLQQENADQQVQIDQNDEDIETLNVTQISISDKLEEKCQQIDDLNTTQMEIEGKLEEKCQQIDGLNTTQMEIEGKLEVKCEQIDLLNITQMDIKDKLEEKCQQIDDLNTTQMGIVDELQVKRQQIDDLNTTQMEIKDKLDVKCQQIDNLNITQMEIEDKLQDKCDEIHLLNTTQLGLLSDLDDILKCVSYNDTNSTCIIGDDDTSITNVVLQTGTSVISLHNDIQLTANGSITSCGQTGGVIAKAPTPAPTPAPTCAPVSFAVVANNANPIPGDEDRNFSSYNPPSVNEEGLVVFRARSTGKQNMGREPATGVFVRDMASLLSSIIRQASRGSTVPQPNNLNTTFKEFPSFPRMAISTDHIAMRGNSQGPVYRYEVMPGNESSETRVGNTGLYFNLITLEDDSTTNDTSPNVQTAAAKLGAVPEFSFIYQVPGQGVNGTVFDVYPGAPAITGEGLVAFKGNFGNGTDSFTGVFYRKVIQAELGGEDPTILVADSRTKNPQCPGNTNFGSTAPPSAAGNKMVFLGLDNEEEPTCGGIFEATMDGTERPNLNALVDLGTTVPGKGEEFARIGEGLSYDGEKVAFWGSWGDDYKTVSLCCPETGNRERREFCVKNDTETNPPDGFVNCSYQNRTVPVNQGIFVVDAATKDVTLVQEANFEIGETFVFWGYSGKPPGTGNPAEGESDPAEPPRWRSAAFTALSSTGKIAYKMQKGNGNNVTSGIYVGRELIGGNFEIETLVETGMNCTILDEDAVDGDGYPYSIESVAIERDGFRGNNLALAAACGTVEESEEEDGGDAGVEGDWGGIYLADIC